RNPPGPYCRLRSQAVCSGFCLAELMEETEMAANSGSSTFSVESLTGQFGWNRFPEGSQTVAGGRAQRQPPVNRLALSHPGGSARAFRHGAILASLQDALSRARQPGVAALDPRLPSFIPPG